MTYETDSAAFLGRLKQVGAEVEVMLENLLAEAPLPGEIDRPAQLLAAMRHGVLAGGKPTHPDGAIRAALCVGLARASGLGGMAGGQMLDLAAESAPAPLDGPAIERLQAMKTGALLRFSIDAGAILAQATPHARSSLSRCGGALGAAFQIADDILDAEGDEAALGKRAGKDADRNKATFVSAFGVEQARIARDRLIAQAQAAIDEAGLGESGDMLRAAAHFIASRAN